MFTLTQFICVLFVASSDSLLINDILSGVGIVNTLDVSNDVINEVTQTVSKEALFAKLLKALTGAIEFPNLLSNLNVTDLELEKEYTKGLSSGYANLPFQRLSLAYGYATERHTVVTADGYELTMFRIPRSGSVVFLMHGTVNSADDFITSGPKSSLAYLLADAGYDVWLGNARGNKHSRSNIRLKPSEGAFWDFSWHEIGILDLPAMIDFVLEKTGQSSLKYIGQSQGTTVFYVMASERPEYNQKVSLMISLAPVAYASHITSPFLRLLAGPAQLSYPIVKLIGANEFLPDSLLLRALKMLFCGTGIAAKIFCSNLMFLIAGFDYAQLNVTNLPVIYGHVPSGAATKQIIHYAQCVNSGQFRKFDYGHLGNIKRYGSVVPPKYELRNVVAPVSLFYSDADWLSHPTDVERLRSELGNVVDYYKVPFYPFNHIDYFWAKDLKELIFRKVEELFELY